MAQIVTLGKTQSGIPGLFTNGMLAWNLTPEQYELFSRDSAALIAYVTQRGFELALIQTLTPEPAPAPAPVPAPVPVPLGSTRCGPMTVSLDWKQYSVELTGSNAKVWDGYGLPSYEGPIDGVEQTYPELFAHLLKCGAIKRTGKD